ncbi:MAG: hypothetical protein H7Y88_05995, partial [Phycisphaerales bacterium]|nr:hypothetical protein [Phycisphaerales bacterium]
MTTASVQAGAVGVDGVMSSVAGAPVHLTDCPRCGYDLGGVIKAWSASCPLEGECSECGLTFAWCDVILGSLRPPKWSFEHAKRWLVWRLERTLARSLTPWRLWRTLRMEHPVRLGRLAVYLIGALVVYTTTLLVLGIAEPLVWNAVQGRGAWTWTQMSRENGAALVVRAIWPYSDRYWSGGSSLDGTAPLLCIISAATMLVPVCFVLLPSTLRSCRVRRVHLVRIGAYSVAGVTAPWLLLRMIDLFAASGLMVPLVWVIETKWLAPTGSALWLLFYWPLACRQYLRLPHALGVGVSIAAISLLLTT